MEWLLAQAMGVQLVFATAMLDYDTLEEFFFFALAPCRPALPCLSSQPQLLQA